MKPFQLNPQQQQQFAQRFTAEMERLTMSWDNELREWYEYAIYALRFANVRDLNIPQNKFIELLNQEKQGLNMNVVGVLCNNLESRSAKEMDMTTSKLGETLLLNHRISTRWQKLALPFQEKLLREFDIMNSKVPGLKLVTGEA